MHHVPVVTQQKPVALLVVQTNTSSPTMQLARQSAPMDISETIPRACQSALGVQLVSINSPITHAPIAQIQIGWADQMANVSRLVRVDNPYCPMELVVFARRPVSGHQIRPDTPNALRVFLIVITAHWCLHVKRAKVDLERSPHWGLAALVKVDAQVAVVLQPIVSLATTGGMDWVADPSVMRTVSPALGPRPHAQRAPQTDICSQTTILVEIVTSGPRGSIKTTPPVFTNAGRAAHLV